MLSESPIQTQDFGQAKPVNVGWGSSDTQFRGSIGKAAGRATAETSTDDYLNKDKDVSRPTVSWRGDSAHFAVSTAEGPNPDQLRRIIRFFSRTAVLQSTAEPSPGLEHALAWQPSGSIIASTSISAATAATTSTAAQRDVIFYERNGLRRYDFPLLSAEDTVKSLTWSPDSALLAVWRSDGHRDSVQLAFRNNYHWYLKQDLSIPSGRDGSLELVDVFFDPDNAIQLFLVSSHSICSFTLQWDVISSLRPPPHDSGLVAVIDGKDLLVTPFRYENVPPPMSSYRLSSPRHPQSVPIHASFSTEDDLLLVLYQDLTFDVWQCFPALAAQDRQTPQLIYSAELKPSSGLQPIQTAIQGSLQDGIIHISVLGHRTDASTVRTASIDLKAQNIMEYPPVPGELFEQLHATLQGFVTQTGNGAFRMISIEGDEVPLDDHLSLPESCVKIQLVLQPRVPESVMIGLTGSGRLYAGQELVSAEATSFVVCGDYLIFTTASHFARFVALLDLSHPEGKIADFDPTKAQERRLERGSRIVTGITSSMTLVLQMPRGNLETICPRPLVLQVVTGDLDSLRYREAFINCRKHRIDLNLLADHDPTVFMDNLDLFLDQIPEGDHLNLFVSALR